MIRFKVDPLQKLLCIWKKTGRMQPLFRYDNISSKNTKSFSRSFTTSDDLSTFPKDTVVLFFSNYLPEPKFSAAGIRTSNLIQYLQHSRGVASIHYATSTIVNDSTLQITSGSYIEQKNTTTKATVTSTEKYMLEELGVQFHFLPANQSDKARELLTKIIPQTDNLLVVFDRFYAEEMYSFFVHQHCSKNAVLVLDMQDIHSLRWARQDVYLNGKSRKDNKIACYDDSNFQDALSNVPINVIPKTSDQRLLREISSIHRCGLTLVCSEAELKILLSPPYSIRDEKLCLAPLFEQYQSSNSTQRGVSPNPTKFQDSQDYIFIGGFKHDPNVDAVLQLKKLWPQIRDGLAKKSHTNVNLHVYGAHCPESIKRQCHDPAMGFHIHGYSASSVDSLLADRRIMLAPLRFGAGIKGKIVDAWSNGVPVVTTPIGSEGMEGVNKTHWGGFVAENSTDFVRAAVDLYTDSVEYTKKVAVIPSLLSTLTGRHMWQSTEARLIWLMQNKEKLREEDLNRSLLWYQNNRSTEYFSKYIECHEKSRQK